MIFAKNGRADSHELVKNMKIALYLEKVISVSKDWLNMVYIGLNLVVIMWIYQNLIKIIIEP